MNRNIGQFETFIPVHELFHKTIEQQNILMFFNRLIGYDICNTFYGMRKKLTHKVGT